MGGNSLPKRIILKKSSEFGIIFQQGRAVKNEYFSIYFIHSKELKVGFAATGHCKNKPLRNKLKRIARELWRTNYRNYRLFAHIVIVVHERVLSAEHNLRVKAFTELLVAVQNNLQADALTE